jgi:DNA-binding CsgD family transcriptional regulator
MPRDAWDDQQISELKKRWSKGQSIFEIAALMKRTPNSVKSKLRRLHLPLGNQRSPRYAVQR